MSTILIKQVKEEFVNTFKIDPILIFSPGRINIIGEHTDYNGGYVFPAAVNKGIAAAMQKSNTNVSTAYAIDKDSKIEFELDNLKPSKEGNWENYVFGVIAEIQNKNKTIGNFNIAFKGMILISQKAEHNYVGVKCGIMDQYASMFGVKNNALLLDCRTIESKPYEIDFKDHQLMLINTNVKHTLSDSAYNDRRSACESIAELLDIETLREASEKDLEKIIDKVTPENYQKALYVIQEIDRTEKAAKAIEENDLETLGALIYGSHNGLQHQYKVSCDELDFLVNQAKKNKNVLGARMMGGGFGGCTINLIKKDEAKKFAESASKAYKNKFDKDCSVYFVELSEGTHLVNNQLKKK